MNMYMYMYMYIISVWLPYNPCIHSDRYTVAQIHRLAMYIHVASVHVYLHVYTCTLYMYMFCMHIPIYKCTCTCRSSVQAYIVPTARFI